MRLDIKRINFTKACVSSTLFVQSPCIIFLVFSLSLSFASSFLSFLLKFMKLNETSLSFFDRMQRLNLHLEEEPTLTHSLNLFFNEK
jgi:hypothetical protein